MLSDPRSNRRFTPQMLDWLSEPPLAGAPSPGPWSAGIDCVRDVEGRLVAVTAIQQGRDTVQANVALLAAAPSMYLACRDALDLLTVDECPDGLTEDDWIDRVVRRLRDSVRAAS